MKESMGKYLQGKIYLSDQAEHIYDAKVQKMIVIAVVDISEQHQPIYQGCGVFSTLLPPTGAVTEIINGSIRQGLSMYMTYLGSLDAEPAITSLLATLYQKTQNILLYTEQDSNKEFYILDTISKFLLDTFGIGCGLYGNKDYPPFEKESPKYDYALASLLFRSGFINTKTYAIMLPSGVVPDIRECQVLLKDYNLEGKSRKEILMAGFNTITNLKREIKDSMMTPLVFSDPTKNIPTNC